MSTALIGLAAQVGAPLVGRILEGRLGGAGGTLADELVSRIAAAAGVPVSQIDGIAAEQPDLLRPAIEQVEASSPEIVALYAAGLERQFALADAETQRESWISWAWRPAAMWGFGILWFWNIIVIHVANAWWRIALPQTDLVMLFQLNAVYMGLYMGGHTVKDFVATKWGGAHR